MSINFDIKAQEMLASIETKKTEETTPFPNKLEEAVVAFVDLLGTQDLMRKIQEDKVEDTYRKIKGISNIFRDLFNQELRGKKAIYMEISDSFVIATDINYLDSLLRMLSLFQYKVFYEHKEIMRGGVSLDKIIDGINEKEHLIIGPAFIKARLLEDRVANYPRIIIGEELIKRCNNNLITRDRDEIYFLDFLSNTKKRKGDIETLLEIVNTKILENTDLKIKQKYGWLKGSIEKIIGGKI